MDPPCYRPIEELSVSELISKFSAGDYSEESFAKYLSN